MSDELTLMVGERRLAGDARRGRDIPSDVTFTTSCAGGFGDLSCGVLRELGDVDEEQPDEPVRLVADGGATEAYSGLLVEYSQDVTRSRATGGPAAKGLRQLLEDDEAGVLIAIDRDPSHWGPSTPERQSDVINAPFKTSPATADAGRLTFDGSGAWNTPSGRPFISSYYDARPSRIGKVGWSGARSVNIGSDWEGFVNRISGNGRVATSTIVPTEWITAPYVAGAESIHPARVYDMTSSEGAEILAYFPTHPVTDADTTRRISIEGLVVIADHDIPLRGTGPASWGIAFSDLLRWLITRRVDPRVTPGDITDSIIGIPHLVWSDGATVGQMIADANAFHAWPWGIFDHGMLHAAPWGEGHGRIWHARLSDAGVSTRFDRRNTASLYTDLVVTYRTTGGDRWSVGAPGTAAHEYDARLQITDPTHPLVQSGRRRVRRFEMPIPSDDILARAVGQIVLAQTNASRRSGRLTLTGDVVDEYGNREPAWKVRGGDQVVITDSGDPVLRRITETSWSRGTRAVTAQLDRTLQTAEALIAHLSARGTGLTA